jgi:uncharacterized membrane protein YbaN (DUF454 family)
MENIFERIVTSIYAIAGTLLFAVAVITMGLSVWDVATHFTSVEALTAPLLHSIGAIVISIAIIDVARYVFEQEVLKPKLEDWRPPIAATETLKKMFVIISIAVSLEGLVYVFKAGAEDLVIITSVLAMVGLGLYQWLVAKAEIAPSISTDKK